jgi:hypothetical protein
MMNYQHREQSRVNKPSLGYLKDMTDKRCAIIIPSGVSKGDADNTALTKAYLACSDFRGLDNLLFHARLLKTASDLYEATLVE